MLTWAQIPFTSTFPLKLFSLILLFSLVNFTVVNGAIAFWEDFLVATI